MILLLDIGNTNSHVGLAGARGISKRTDFPTIAWSRGYAAREVKKFTRGFELQGAAMCSVVPRVTPRVHSTLRRSLGLKCLELKPGTLRGIGIDYPNPETIGPDRLANAVAVRHHFGAPAVVVDFGTAVTFDVVNSAGNYCGGIIGPGLAAMTDYLHEKTALLPRVKIRPITKAIGKSTEQAILIGAVHGYRGMVRQLISELKRELKARRLPVVATGGYAKLIAATLPEIAAVDPDITLEGLRLVWLRTQKPATDARDSSR